MHDGPKSVGPLPRVLGMNEARDTAAKRSSCAGHLIHYKVNDEPQETRQRELTPRQIMSNSGVNPDENYLVEIEGHHRKSYKDKTDTPIHMHEHMVFITIFIGPVPVS